ncbi:MULTISPECIES: DUF805 domain-containing protein [unclassified Brevundimonas]|uniref:DUF805 domain-containing protein n=1 Tax=unclassified Brevundimonas TaxID=2622653 RepID=UPI0025B9DBF8|nr:MULTISPECIES: DUF805 domain-containing protein [unclassified Brevundimonas]
MADFRGRDRRGRFWPYALVVAVLLYVGMAAAMIPTMSGVFEEAARYAAENPEQVTVTAGPGHYSVQIHDPEAQLMPDMSGLFWAVRTVFVVAGVLLAAAVTRRLHDTGRAGWWGLPPLLFAAIASILFPTVMEQMTQSEEVAVAPFLLLLANNMLYLASLIGLIVLLCLKGASGPNRYGPEPG